MSGTHFGARVNDSEHATTTITPHGYYCIDPISDEPIYIIGTLGLTKRASSVNVSLSVCVPPVCTPTPSGASMIVEASIYAAMHNGAISEDIIPSHANSTNPMDIPFCIPIVLPSATPIATTGVTTIPSRTKDIKPCALIHHPRQPLQRPTGGVFIPSLPMAMPVSPQVTTRQSPTPARRRILRAGRPSELAAKARAAMTAYTAHHMDTFNELVTYSDSVTSNNSQLINDLGLHTNRLQNFLTPWPLHKMIYRIAVYL